MYDKRMKTDTIQHFLLFEKKYSKNRWKIDTIFKDNMMMIMNEIVMQLPAQVIIYLNSIDWNEHLVVIRIHTKTSHSHRHDEIH